MRLRHIVSTIVTLLSLNSCASESASTGSAAVTPGPSTKQIKTWEEEKAIEERLAAMAAEFQELRDQMSAHDIRRFKEFFLNLPSEQHSALECILMSSADKKPRVIAGEALFNTVQQAGRERSHQLTLIGLDTDSESASVPEKRPEAFYSYFKETVYHRFQEMPANSDLTEPRLFEYVEIASLDVQNLRFKLSRGRKFAKAEVLGYCQ